MATEVPVDVPPAQRGTSFLVAFVLVSFLMVVTMVGANIVVDPFGLFGLVRIEGFNAVKSEATTFLRLAKANLVAIVKPEAVIFGSSRAELGLDPRHPGFAGKGRKTYSMAMAGIGIGELVKTVKHSYFATGKRLKLALVALDEYMFNAYREAVVFGTEVIGFEESRLCLNEAQNRWHTHFADIASFIGPRGLGYCIRTPQGQKALDYYDLATGIRAAWTSEQYRQTIANCGHDMTFRRNERGYVHHIWLPPPNRLYGFEGAGQPNTIEVFRELVGFCRSHGIELIVLLSPVHAQVAITFREAGLWPIYEEWKRGLVRVIDDDARSHPGARPFPLWDFSGFNTVTTEPLPPKGDKRQMRWHWDFHYRFSAGDLVLDRVFSYHDPTRVVPDDFGTLLDAGTVEPHLAQQFARMWRYDKEAPEAVAQAQEVVNATINNLDATARTAVTVCIEKGAVAEGLGDVDAAIAAYSDAVSRSAAVREAYRARDLTYRNAREVCQAYVRRAALREKRQKLDLARADCESALRLKPDLVTATVTLQRLLKGATAR